MTMAPKVALITGTNSGIGLSTAVQLCQAGYTTYASVRSLSKAGALKKAGAAAGVASLLKIIEMDVGSDESVATAVKALLAETENVIDVTIANAGYADLAPPEAASVGAFEANMNVNLYGVVRLANAVLPAMRAARRGRFIATSSVAGLMATPMKPVYVSTKFALEGYMESMAASYASVGIHFSLVEPGPVASEVMANSKGNVEAAPAELRPAAQACHTAFLRMMADPLPAEECAKYFLRAATDERPHLRYMAYEEMAPALGVKCADLTGEKTLAVLTSISVPPTESSGGCE